MKKILLKYISPRHKRLFLVLIVSGVVTAGLELLTALVVSLLGVAISAPNKLVDNDIVKIALKFGRDFISGGDSQILLIFLVLICLCVVVGVKNCSSLITIWLQNYASTHAARDVGARLFQSYLANPFVWHSTHNTSELQLELSWRNNVSEFLVSILNVCISLCIVLVLLGASLAISPVPTLVVFVTTGGVAMTYYVAIKDKVKKLSREVSLIEKGMAKVTLSALQGIQEVKIYQQDSAIVDQYLNCSSLRPLTQSRARLLSASPMLLLEFMGVSTLLLSFALLFALDMPFSELVFSVSLLAGVSWRLLPAFNKIVGNLGTMQLHYPYVDAVLGRLEHCRCPCDSSRCEYVWKESLFLKDVTFCYPGSSEYALKGISIFLQKGDFVGIIGGSGAGKSTLVGILTGLLSLNSGELYLDSEPVASQSVDCWSGRIGYVPQQIYLHEASLAENIAFSENDGEIDTEKVYACCEMAAIDFLDDLEDGIYTLIGERGAGLSGGQMQRVAIARALYCDPEILVFDEATSALDMHTERAVQQAIDNISDSITVVIVSHNTNMLQNCRCVYWIDGGRVVQQGSPGSVLKGYIEHIR